MTMIFFLFYVFKTVNTIIWLIQNSISTHGFFFMAKLNEEIERAHNSIIHILRSIIQFTTRLEYRSQKYKNFDFSFLRLSIQNVHTPWSRHL